MIQGHPLGVKPQGNALLEPDFCREKTMGQLGLLSDELLLTVLQELDGESLLSLAHTCKALYAYCWFDELWKRVVYKQKTPSQWRGSWRKTALGIDEEPKIDATSKVFSDNLYRPFELSQMNFREKIRQLNKHEIRHVKESELDSEKFLNDYYRSPFIAKLSKPIAAWTIQDLVNKFGNEIFRQEYMDWPLNLYAEYMKSNMDETPLYLFDCRSKAHKALVFEVPLANVFGQDFFTLLGQDRPDHQWLIIGPKRSGSNFHKDPNGTSAWNSIVSGQKYWIMFPPHLNPPGIWTDAEQSEVTAPVSLAEWFAAGFYEEALESEGFCHGITGPGECMYVPSGWWHAVVNLEECIAMTGNFVPDPQLKNVLKFLRNKPDQISGFDNPDGLYDKFCALLGDKAPKSTDPPVKKAKIDLTVSDAPFTFSF